MSKKIILSLYNNSFEKKLFVFYLLGDVVLTEIELKKKLSLLNCRNVFEVRVTINKIVFYLLQVVAMLRLTPRLA